MISLRMHEEALPPPNRPAAVDRLRRHGNKSMTSCRPTSLPNSCNQSRLQHCNLPVSPCLDDINHITITIKATWKLLLLRHI